MPTEASGSFELPDPLSAYSYLSLFPRTCRTLGVVAKPTELSDIESVHNVLKTVGLKETSWRIEQARLIVESGLEDMPLEATGNAADQKEVESVGLVTDEIERKRRPGLGRAQAKFNINRRVSQPALTKEPKLDISQLEDPEEFFMAHERLENAKKELRKQSGILPEMDVDINDMSLKARRPHRPGIPGRSKATYKHHCPSGVSNDDILNESSAAKDEKGITSSLSLPTESFVLSQQNSKENHQSPINVKTIPEATDAVKDGVLFGSISEVNGFMDEILSGTYDHLNSEGQLTLLQEQLQIKPISIDNLSLPKLPDIPKYDFKISENFPKPRKSMLGIQAAFTGTNTKTPVKASLTPGSVRFSASPTPPKSPFANLSSLKKHIMELNKSKDSFSDFNTDLCSVGGSSPVNCTDKQPDSVDVQGDSRSNFEVFTYVEGIAAVSNKSSNHELLRDSGGFPDPMDDIPTMVAGASSMLSTKSGSDVSNENGVPMEPQSMAEYYSGSPGKEHSDTLMQSGNATVALNSSEPDPRLVDHHSSPGAGGSHGKLQSTISNLCSAQHEQDIQVEGDTKIPTNNKTRRKTVPVHRSRTTIVHPQRDGITDNSPSLGNELHEKQTELPDIDSALEKTQETSESAINHKRKGKRGPVQEHDVRVEVRKKQKRKGGVSRKRDDAVALTKESCDDQYCLTGSELHDNQSEIPEQHQELMEGNVPKASLNKKSQPKDSSQEQMEHTKEVIHPRKKAKRLSLRKSIAVAGTSFQSGMRRSTRVRMRPLEFWRGERYLYGRLEPDSTLPTLIGFKKYDTPAKKEGKATLKVHACVDGNKYRELIDLVARH